MTRVQLPHEDLVGCLEAEAFSGAVVETMHGELDVFAGNGFEAHFLREELADQAVHVLVGTALPGGVGMGEEELASSVPAMRSCWAHSLPLSVVSV
jgi:hypothetical protein